MVNKKGNAVESLVIILLFFILATFSVVCLGSFHGFYSNILNDTSDTNPFNSTESKAIISNMDSTFPSFWDKCIFSFLMGLFCYVLISAYFIDTHPIFYIFGVLLLIPIGFVSMYLNNFFFDIVGDSVDRGYVLLQMPLTDYVMSHFLIFALCIGFATLIMLYIKGRKNPYGGTQW